MTFFQDVSGGQRVVFHGLIDCKASRNREQQMLFAEKAFTVDGTVHTPVVNQKIQGAGEEPLGQFRGGGLHQIQVHLGDTAH